MGDLVGQLPAVAGIIEKGGVVGLLLIVVAVLGWEVIGKRKELAKVYAQRDKYRMGFALCKAECDRANLKPDLSMLNDLLKENGELA